MAPSEVAQKRATIAAVYLGTFMCIMAVSLVGVTLPAIQAGLKLEFSSLQWVVGAYTLCLSAFMLSSGPISDRWGRKRTWLGGMAMFVAGSTICALAPSILVLVVGRAIQGTGAALIIPGALSILTHAFIEPGERARVIGGWSAMSNLSLILGPAIGGMLVDHVGWHAVFFCTVPLGILALVFGAYGLRETADPDQAAYDRPGQILSIIVLGTLTYALINGGKIGWGVPATLAPLGAALVALVIFIGWELRAKNPLLPIDLFRNSGFASANFASFVLGFAAYPCAIFFSLFMQQAQGWSASETGWRLAPVFTAVVCTNFVYGWLDARFKTNVLLTLSYVLLGLSMVAIALLLRPTTPYWNLFPLFVVFGVGLGLAVPSTDIVVMATVPRARSGIASATMNMLRQSGMTMGIALLGVVLQAGAIQSMSRSLTDAKVAGAAALAGASVRRHAMPAGLEMAPDLFQRSLAAAFSHGFSSLFWVTGIFSLVAVAVLRFRVGKDAVAQPR